MSNIETTSGPDGAIGLAYGQHLAVRAGHLEHALAYGLLIGADAIPEPAVHLELAQVAIADHGLHKVVAVLVGRRSARDRLNANP